MTEGNGTLKVAAVGDLHVKTDQPPNLRELISSADGVTFWARYDKAERELGYSPRGMEEGLRQTLEADSRFPDPVA